MALGGGEVARLVQQPAEVEVSVHQVGVELEGPPVGGHGAARVLGFEIDAVLVPVGGGIGLGSGSGGRGIRIVGIRVVAGRRTGIAGAAIGGGVAGIGGVEAVSPGLRAPGSRCTAAPPVPGTGRRALGRAPERCPRGEGGAAEWPRARRRVPLGWRARAGSRQPRGQRCLGSEAAGLERGRLPRQVGDLEVEQGLARFGVPGVAAVAGDHVMALRRDAHGGQRLSLRQLGVQVLERDTDAAPRNAGGDQRLGGAQQDQVLEREQQLAARPGLRRDEAGPDAGADLRRRQAEQRRDLAG